MPCWILIVEDDDGIAEALADLLGDEGYTTARAKDGSEALAMLKTRDPPCLMTVDLFMPGVGGKELLKRRGIDYPSSIPVALFTAVADVTFSTPPLPPVDAILKKPCDPAEVIELVRRHCGPPQILPS